MLHIPDDFTEFLYWVKERTEAHWQRPRPTSEAEYPREAWGRGARWQPLTDAQIDAVEARYGVRFIPEHRAFLRVLHTLDRREQYTEIRPELNLETAEYEDELVFIDNAYFYNWLTDEAEIRYRLAYPYDTVLWDVLGPNQVWLDAWGSRPATAEEQKAVFARWYAQAPRLLPMTRQHFVVGESGQPKHPVLSMYGADTIVHDWSLRTYLLNMLPIEEDVEWVYDEEDQQWYWRLLPEVQQLFEAERQAAPHQDIPYWKDLIRYWSPSL